MKILTLWLSLWVLSIAHADLPFGSEFAGNYWSKLDEKTKPVFLTGFCLGAGQAGFGTAQQPFSLRPEQIPKLIPLIDAFYKVHPDPDMLLSSVTEICLMQLVGRPQEQIDEKIKLAQRPWK